MNVYESNHSFVFGQANFQWSAGALLCFWTTHVSSSISSAPPSWQTKSVDSRVRPNRKERDGRGATANVSCPKTFFLAKSVYTNNVLNARVGDATSKVSCCVEPS